MTDVCEISTIRIPDSDDSKFFRKNSHLIPLPVVDNAPVPALASTIKA